MSFRFTATLAAVFVFTLGSAQAGKPELRADQAAGTKAQVQLGATSFTSCAACHGTKGEGGSGLAPALVNNRYLEVVSNEALKHTIAEGRANTSMMAWKSMFSEDELDGLVALLRSWQRSEAGPINTEPLTGDVATGESVYRDNCASCHGKKARGYSQGASAPAIGRVGFLSTVSDGELRAMLRSGRGDTVKHPSKGASAAVGKLSQVQIDSVLQYLRATAK